MVELIPRAEIAFSVPENAFKVAEALLEEGYVVMLSREEDLYIVNFLYSKYADRNDVVFMDRDIFECDYVLRDMDENS